MTQYRSFSDAFNAELRALIRHGTPAEAIVDPGSPASDFGHRPRESLERIGMAFSTLSVVDNIGTCTQIPFNLTYGVGLFLWSIAGSDDLDTITYYRAARPKGKKISFGQRMLRADGKHDLMQLALKRLNLDPGSRRAYLPIFSTSDLFEDGEIPCAIGFHLHQRGGALHAVTIMRAQNATTAWPMDYFLFSSFLRFAAATAGLAEGTYTQLNSTFHAFREDIDRLKGDLQSGLVQTQAFGLGSMINLPGEIDKLIKFEAQLRFAVGSQRLPEVLELVNQDRHFESDAGKTIARILISIALKRLGASPWSHPLLELQLSALIR